MINKTVLIEELNKLKGQYLNSKETDEKVVVEFVYFINKLIDIFDRAIESETVVNEDNLPDFAPKLGEVFKQPRRFTRGEM